MREEAGTAGRAFRAWRVTATVVAILWLAMHIAVPSSVVTTAPEHAIAWDVNLVLSFVIAIYLVLPAFVFTIGRSLDRVSTQRGLRHSVIVFASVGFAFGLIPALLAATSTEQTMVAALLFVAATTVAAAAGRLLVELTGRAWTIVFWVTFAIIILAPVVLLAGAPSF